MTVRIRKGVESAVIPHMSGNSHANWEPSGSPSAPTGRSVGTSSSGEAVDPARSMIGISIQTLGGFHVTRRDASGALIDVPPSAWRHGRSLALAHYLITKPGFESSRDAIRDALWPNVESHAASAYLSNTIWNLRKALGVTRDDRNFLQVTETVVRLNVVNEGNKARATARASGNGVWLDILAFEAAINLLKRGQGSEERLLAAQRALALYQGDFLPECSEPHWCLATRERYRALWASAQMATAHAYLEMRASDEALYALDCLLAVMPDHEEGAMIALRLLMDQKRQREVRALYERIRAFYRDLYHQNPPLSLREIVGPALTSRRTTIPLPRKP